MGLDNNIIIEESAPPNETPPLPDIIEANTVNATQDSTTNTIIETMIVNTEMMYICLKYTESWNTQPYGGGWQGVSNYKQDRSNYGNRSIRGLELELSTSRGQGRYQDGHSWHNGRGR